MFTKEQQAHYDALLPAEVNQPSETVLYMRMTAVNTAQVPRYAFFSRRSRRSPRSRSWTARFSKAKRYRCCSNPAKPRFSIPTCRIRPIEKERARRLREVRFEERLAECRAYWKQKLDGASHIRVPEKRVDEMIRAGLLHLDLITYGREPEATLTSTIGGL